MADNSIVSDEIWLKFKLIHAFLYVLVTYKNEDQMKKNALEWSKHYRALF